MLKKFYFLIASACSIAACTSTAPVTGLDTLSVSFKAIVADERETLETAADADRLNQRIDGYVLTGRPAQLNQACRDVEQGFDEDENREPLVVTLADCELNYGTLPDLSSQAVSAQRVMKNLTAYFEALLALQNSTASADFPVALASAIAELDALEEARPSPGLAEELAKLSEKEAPIAEAVSFAIQQAQIRSLKRLIRRGQVPVSDALEVLRAYYAESSETGIRVRLGELRQQASDLRRISDREAYGTALAELEKDLEEFKTSVAETTEGRLIALATSHDALVQASKARATPEELAEFLTSIRDLAKAFEE